MKRSGSCVPSAHSHGRRGLWSNMLAGPAHRLSSWVPGCFFLTVSYKYSVLHDACWFQVVWDALEHLGSLSLCGFPTLWDDSILFCVVRKAEGELGLLFSVFCVWLCKVSELKGWNWELLRSVVWVSASLCKVKVGKPQALSTVSSQTQTGSFSPEAAKVNILCLTQTNMLVEILTIWGWNILTCLNPDLSLYQVRCLLG